MRRSCGAFTIIELLLALMLTALLTAALSLMIGQAARDRQAMRDRPDEPAWAGQVLDQIERDLHQARWWAAADDRLVLIGPGREGTPAQIEYRWSRHDEQSAWARHENPLTNAPASSRADTIEVLAIDVAGLKIGPNQYGLAIPDAVHPSLMSTAVSPSRTASGSGPSILVNNQRVPLRPLPDRIELSLALRGDKTPRTLQREVILR